MLDLKYSTNRESVDKNRNSVFDYNEVAYRSQPALNDTSPWEISNASIVVGEVRRNIDIKNKFAERRGGMIS